MKTYSLHPDFFGFFCETCETLDYLESAFPGLLDEKAIGKYLSSGNDGASALRFSVIHAFIEPYMDAINSTKRSMHGSSMQQHVTLDENDLDDKLISDAIHSKLIVVNHSINFSSDEIRWLKFLATASYASDNVDSTILLSIKEKIYGTEKYT